MPTVDKSSGSGLHIKPPRVAAFTLLELIHEGSCGSIYRARQDRLGRIVALKTLSEWPPPTDVALERFNRAAYVSAQSPHPNLVTLYDTGTADGFHFASMEYLNGQTVQKHLSVVGLVDEPFAISVAVQVLRGLNALHSREICHRNVKPKNMFLETSGNVRLIGLGLASCRTAFFSPNLDARPIGTPHFMSPEMIRGSYADPRSDLYSLGVTLFVIVTGTTPFEKGSPPVVMSRHLTDSVIPLAKARPGLSPEFVAFVETLMAREADQRFQSAGSALEAAAALEKCDAGRMRSLTEQMDSRARPQEAPPRAYPLRRASRPSQPLLVALLAGLGTVLLMAGLWILIKGHKPDNSQDPAAIERETTAQPDPEENAEFERLLDQDSRFHADPFAGASLWEKYLRTHPKAAANRLEFARKMADSYRKQEESRHKAAPAGRNENPDF
ncbi:MAG: serine/threonine-protein kinase [Planctomycetota bacterium]